nr:DUF2497 domain-containing protein [Ancylobacter tetraedralis]
MSANARASEPSMEEILASIRRIISDDVAGDPPSAPAESSRVEMAMSSRSRATELPREEGEPSGDALAPEQAPASWGEEAHSVSSADDLAYASLENEPVVDAFDPRHGSFATDGFAGLPDAPDAVDAAVSSRVGEGSLVPSGAAVKDERRSAFVPRAADGLTDIPASLRAAFAMIEATSVPETVDMQVPAKPVPVSSRAYAAESAEDNRAPEANAGSRFAEPRFAPSLRSVAAEASVAEGNSRLVSNITTAAVSNAFGTLARTVASNSRSVDDLVAEAVRPMLKAWLDENLPALVERLVRAEIERVTRQGQ